MRLMLDNPFHRAVYLTGATAVGKTAVGVALARRLDAEIIALDSMTLYRGMDIGTAKPNEEERGGVPHHLIDVVDAWESASVAQYLGWAAAVFREIEARGNRVLFVGGTPLYLKALLRGLFEGPAANLRLREELEAEAERDGDGALHQRLGAIDPSTAKRLHPNDRRRVIRALEVASATGRPMSDFQKEHDQTAPETVAVFSLERPREELCARIDQRVLTFFEEGLIEEVRGLLGGMRPLHDVPAQGVGYREVIELLAGRVSGDETIRRVQARTRQFAKRQGTWFRGLKEVRPFGVSGEASIGELAGRLAERVMEVEHESDLSG